METEHEKAVKLSHERPELSRRIEEIVLGGDLSDALVKLKAAIYDELQVIDLDKE